MRSVQVKRSEGLSRVQQHDEIKVLWRNVRLSEFLWVCGKNVTLDWNWWYWAVYVLLRDDGRCYKSQEMVCSSHEKGRVWVRTGLLWKGGFRNIKVLTDRSWYGGNMANCFVLHWPKQIHIILDNNNEHFPDVCSFIFNFLFVFLLMLKWWFLIKKMTMKAFLVKGIIVRYCLFQLIVRGSFIFIYCFSFL